MLWLLPGAFYGLVVLLAGAAGGLASSLLATIGIVAFFCGLFSLLTTPLGILLGIRHRPWHNDRTRVVWLVMSLLGAWGTGSLFLRYMVGFDG